MAVGEVRRAAAEELCAGLAVALLSIRAWPLFVLSSESRNWSLEFHPLERWSASPPCKPKTCVTLTALLSSLLHNDSWLFPLGCPRCRVDATDSEHCPYFNLSHFRFGLSSTRLTGAPGADVQLLSSDAGALQWL